MLLRRVAPAALVTAAICACEPGVGYNASNNPQQTNYAVFDPSAAPPQIPLPNDLALQQAATVPGAQGELLRLFLADPNPLNRGFPNDQEVPISIDLVKIVVDPTGTQVRSKPDLDVGSIRICKGNNPDCNLAVMKLTSPPAFVTDIDQPAATDYVTSGDHGTLTIRRTPRDVPLTPTTTVKSRTWDAGVHYVAAIRGGPSGVTVNVGQPISPQPAMFIIEQGKDLTKRENQGLIPGNSAAEKDATAKQLYALQQQYEAGPFPVISVAFPKTEIATMTTFQIASNIGAPAAHVVIDSGSGTAPLPFNALLDGNTLPDNPLAPATNAKVQNLPSTFGPLADGIAKLDGFSTTAMLLVPVSAPIIAASDPGTGFVSTFKSNVFLYEITDANNPSLVDPATYDDLLPANLLSPISSTLKASVLVALQPAAASKLTTSKPLKEAAEYAVVVTNRILGVDQKGLGRPTVGSVLLFSNPLWVGGKSQLAGISDSQAKSLERMRVQIANLITKLGGTAPFGKSDIAVAYTFRTQTITTPALQLAAAPYDPARNPGVNFVGSINALSPGAAFTKYGVEGFIASGNIQEVIEANLPTPNLLSTATGAFDPALFVSGASPPIDIIPALIAVPKAAAVVNTCPGSTLKCAPLVVFHHGLNGGRAQMLLGADELAAKGFVVAAIDAPKHGDRALCSSNTQCVSPSGTCKQIPGSATQGDTTPPGQCKDASGNPTALVKNPVLCVTPGCTSSATDGIAVASGNYVISGNLFRTRDTFRQDIIDNSGLILALARPPTLPATTNPNNLVTTRLAITDGIAVNPQFVFWEGQSLGGILGTLNVATNPRISEAVLNVPGGTFVDIAATSPAFMNGLIAILGSLPPPVGPILPNTPQFLRFLQVAKWVLDPAEPINFAGRMIGDATHPTLPDLLKPPGTLQGAKKVLGQLAVCDAVVPNAFNLLLFNVAGIAPPPTATTFQNNGFTTFRNTGTPDPNGFCQLPPLGTGAVAHGFLLDHGFRAGPPPAADTNSGTLSLFARIDGAAFLTDPTAAKLVLHECTSMACN